MVSTKRRGVGSRRRVWRRGSTQSRRFNAGSVSQYCRESRLRKRNPGRQYSSSWCCSLQKSSSCLSSSLSSSSVTSADMADILTWPHLLHAHLTKLPEGAQSTPKSVSYTSTSGGTRAPQLSHGKVGYSVGSSQGGIESNPHTQSFLSFDDPKIK